MIEMLRSGFSLVGVFTTSLDFGTWQLSQSATGSRVSKSSLLTQGNHRTGTDLGQADTHPGSSRNN